MRFSALLFSGLLFGLTAQGQTIQRCAADEVYAHEVANDPQREAFRAETEAEMQPEAEVETTAEVEGAQAPDSFMAAIENAMKKKQPQ